MIGRRLVLAVMLMTAAGTAASASLRELWGEARDPASGDLLYREQHLLRRDNGRLTQRLVLYRCPGGTAFARKQVDYRDSMVAPAFALRDVRRGYREGLRREDGQVLVWSGRGEPAPQPLKRSDAPLVADAGFDEYLRDHWQALLDGETVALGFVVPAYGRSLDFEIEHLGAASIDGLAVERFRLELDGLLGLFGPSMTVAYAADDRRLRRFTGLTNLRGDDGEQLHARIDFAQAPRPADPGAWQAALDEPLHDCTL